MLSETSWLSPTRHKLWVSNPLALIYSTSRNQKHRGLFLTLIAQALIQEVCMRCGLSMATICICRRVLEIFNRAIHWMTSFIASWMSPILQSQLKLVVGGIQVHARVMKFHHLNALLKNSTQAFARTTPMFFLIVQIARMWVISMAALLCWISLIKAISKWCRIGTTRHHSMDLSIPCYRSSIATYGSSVMSVCKTTALTGLNWCG